ncbi:recombinase family protein [Krasilnikoviella flava]|uniref:Site-specific DNA recombinase n=1 Tax=Krasilnikoviella flava TaxID=526729 RepID=A0A1T5JBI0_9MICO|nr:recombinase family protein [Krasilnikoviella flava]SKC48755.1 Site-specific DNA recombinase [Krasilnikoviella flava]
MNWDDVPDAEYRRISDDKSGEGRGIARQGEETVALAAAAGRTLSHSPYVDPSVSAADGDAVRPAFERLLEDLEEGRVNGVVASTADRLVRRFDDLQRLLDIWDRAAEGPRVIRPILTATRAYDLHVPSDVMLLAMDVMAADQEIRRTRRRAVQSHLDNARRGRVGGGPRPFGWNDDRRTLHPVESAAVQGAVRDVVAGAAGWGQIANRWNRAGLRTPFDNTWIASNVRATLRNPRLAGIRTYKGEPVVHEDGTYVIGQWQPILTIEQWETYWAVVGPDRGVSRTREPRRYLLSGLLRCSRCAKKLVGKTTSTKGLIYACPPRGAGGCGGTSIRGGAAENLVEELVVQHLETGHGTTSRASMEFTGDAELEEIRATAACLFREIQDGKPSARRLTAIEALEEREALLMRERARSAAGAAREGGKTGDVRAAWHSSSWSTKRSAILDVLAVVVVMPPSGANNRVDPDRLVPTWLHGDSQTRAGHPSA